ncbi:hypothetical protein ACFVWY_02905 [Streptomyces sp. NPDC058195]|uniref:hypothetical protein n=1 Tax=Streptomyces sp. NPDC058195 TaxID=3346375 RepID=UPI0036EC3A44
MATSRSGPRTPGGGLAGRALACLESRKNLAGCTGGLAGLALTFTGLAGAYWPVVVAGLYAAGALIASPERLPAPEFPDASSRLDAVREDFGTLREYLDAVELPPAASGRLTELLELLDGLLAPGWMSRALAADPGGVHLLSRAVHQDVPEAVDTFVRTRWWTRIAPGAEPPERQLEQQLALLHREAAALAAGLRETEARRQRSHTRHLEDRGRNG